MKKLLLMTLIAFALSSCSYAFRDSVRKEAEYALPFISVQADNERCIGYIFIWGGIIANTINTDSGSYMEIVQTPLSKYGRIASPDVRQGRFIVYSTLPLDEQDYRAGRMMSVAGKHIKGIASTLDGKPYTYPLLEAIQLRLWGDIKGEAPAPGFPASPETFFPWDISPLR